MIKENIKALLDSEVSAYQISKDTGIDRARLGRLKKGEIDIGRLTLDTALILNNYWEQIERKDD